MTKKELMDILNPLDDDLEVVIENKDENYDIDSIVGIKNVKLESVEHPISKLSWLEIVLEADDD